MENLRGCASHRPQAHKSLQVNRIDDNVDPEDVEKAIQGPQNRIHERFDGIQKLLQHDPHLLLRERAQTGRSHTNPACRIQESPAIRPGYRLYTPVDTHTVP
jgi:hypothetical protein